MGRVPLAAANQGLTAPGSARRRAGGGWRGGGAGAVPLSLRAAGPGGATMWFGGSVPAAIAAAKERSSVFVVFVSGTVRPGAARCSPPGRAQQRLPGCVPPAAPPAERVLCCVSPSPPALWSGIARPMYRLPLRSALLPWVLAGAALRAVGCVSFPFLVPTVRVS